MKDLPYLIPAWTVPVTTRIVLGESRLKCAPR
jgi:hypothetical protein